MANEIGAILAILILEKIGANSNFTAPEGICNQYARETLSFRFYDHEFRFFIANFHVEAFGVGSHEDVSAWKLPF